MVPGCSQDTATTPTRPPAPIVTTAPSPSPQQGTIRVNGIALDADTDEPIVGAVISVDHVILQGTFMSFGAKPSQPSSTSTDQNGRFVLNANTQTREAGVVTAVVIDLSTSGYESVMHWPKPASGVDEVVRAYRTLTIRPGETIEFRQYLRSYVCGWESWFCRRIVVEAPSGRDVDLEIASLDADGYPGLVPAHGEPFGVNPYITRMTAPPGQVWVIGNGPTTGWPGRRRLTAR